jgi:hypothetical protein
MFDLSAPYSKPRNQKSRKKCLGKQIMAQDPWPSIRLHGIRIITKLHGGKHPGIRPLNIKLLGHMHHGIWHLSISGLSSDLYLPITVTNPSTLKGRRRWKMINTTGSHLFGCKAWWSGWVNRWSPANNHLQEGRLGLERREMLTPWGGMYAPSRKRCSCLGFGP